MQKNIRQFDYQIATSSKSPDLHIEVEWDKCVLCQTVTTEKLVDPVKSKRTDGSSGHRTIAHNLVELKALDHLSDIIKLNVVDNVEEMAQTLIDHQAKWHKSCYGRVDNQSLARAKAKRENDPLHNTSPKKTRHTCDARGQSTSDDPVCFFCEKKGSYYNKLRRASSTNIDSSVRECATKLFDTRNLAKLAHKQFSELNASYHPSCLVKYYRRSDLAHLHTQPSHSEDIDADEHIFKELTSFIEESRSKDNITVFRLSELKKMYAKMLCQFEPDVKINPTHLKDKLLKNVEGLRAENRGQDIFLMYEEDIGEAIFHACVSGEDTDEMHLKRAANIIRREIFNNSGTFTGSFSRNCEEDAVPAKVLELVSMIIDGPNNKSRARTDTCKSPRQKIALALSQLLIFNCVKTSKASVKVRHNRTREPPLPVFLSLYVHNKTRNRALIEKLHEHGIGISYSRVLDISTLCGQSIVDMFNADNLVCPPLARKGVTTGGAIDNIDVNFKTLLAHDSFHGTAISLLQSPTVDNPGQNKMKISFDPESQSSGKIGPLPPSYAFVPTVSFTNKQPKVPFLPGPIRPESNTDMVVAKDQEKEWLTEVKRLFQKENLNDTEFISWAAYHSSKLPPLDHPVSIISLMPMFSENAHSPSMVLHGMHVVRKAIHHLNPGQTPFITGDQPLYALMKQCQWAWPEDVGEDKYVVLMGGLHFEMAVLKMLGKWLRGSGWETVLSESSVSTPGRADEAVKGGNVVRARYYHQVTAASLSILQEKAYANYAANVSDEDQSSLLEFDEWCSNMCADQPQFNYWFETLQMEIDMLIFIRSLREGNFLLYIASLAEILPMLFVMDRTHYSRWSTVHLRDMMLLETMHPDLYRDFIKGHFTAQKSMRHGSNIAHDQAHEQENAKIKGDGGAIGLFHDKAALMRWMVAGPEICRMTKEFEEGQRISKSSFQTHHEQCTSFQSRFKADVTKMVDKVEEMGNPFIDDSGTLYALDTKNIMSADVVDDLRAAREMGNAKFHQFVVTRLQQSDNKPISDTLPNSKLSTFSHIGKKSASEGKAFVERLKADRKLFAEMYISTQSRGGDMDEFFQHENNSSPPSLSHKGQLRKGTKSDLVDCLIEQCHLPSTSPHVTAKILDGPVIVQMISPNLSKTFYEYATNEFVPYISEQLATCQRIDVVWDVYRPDSLKRQTRDQRGFGIRRKVTATTPIPTDWPGFLKVDENKRDLYYFLADQLMAADTLKANGKEIYTTHGETVMSFPMLDVNPLLGPSTQEEADTRVILHAYDCASLGHKSVMIRTVDTDVVVLAIAFFRQLCGLHELFVTFGLGKYIKHIPVHEISDSMGPLMSEALPIFHAISGCDTTSSFNGIGKKTAWKSWKACDSDITDAFVALSKQPDDVSDDLLTLLERFVITMYQRTSKTTSCNEARREMFTGGRSMDNIPPSQGALKQHIHRSVLQAGHCWAQSLVACPLLPSPSEWGWHFDSDTGRWKPVWTTLPEAAKGCRQLIRCGCKIKCSGRCKCLQANLRCTELCKCKGMCRS